MEVLQFRLFCALMLAPLPSFALSVRDDLPDSAFLVPDAQYPALVDLHPGDCMSTLIHETHLLTVAHCAHDFHDGDTLVIHGFSHRIEKVILHPDWDDEENRNDIALIRLDKAVEGVKPIPLFRGSTPEIGARVTLIGRGLHTTGLVGEGGGVEDLKLRRATNVVASVTGQNLVLRFRRPSETGETPLEGVGVSGDSGCPVFVLVDGAPQIIGLNSWGEEGSAKNVGQYGALDYQTRISQFLDWIDGHVGGRKPSRAPISR